MAMGTTRMVDELWTSYNVGADEPIGSEARARGLL